MRSYDEIMTDVEWDAALARRQALIERPDIAAILDRAERLAPAEIAKLEALYWSHYRMYRLAMLSASQRIRGAYREHVHDLGSTQNRVWGKAYAATGSHEVAHAASEAVFAAVAREVMTPDEWRMYTATWEAMA